MIVWKLDEELALLHSIYADLRLYINFFQPVLKLIGKERVDGRTVRTYDQATTPYRRVLALDTLPFAGQSQIVCSICPTQSGKLASQYRCQGSTIVENRSVTSLI